MSRGLAIPGLKRSVRENVFEINGDFSNLIFELFLFHQFLKFAVIFPKKIKDKSRSK
jgi:hypothetical protein